MSTALLLANGGGLSDTLVGLRMSLQQADLESDISRANTHTLDALAKQMWSEYAEGRITEDTAERITRAVERRRAILRTQTRKMRNTPLLDAVKRNKLPVRPDRIQHRRRVAYCGALPGHIAAKFTIGQIAALSIIVAEIKSKGRCELYVGQIAAMAGCCGRVVQTALAEAERHRLIKIERRPRAGRSNLSNIVIAIDPTLLSWIRRGNANKHLHWVNIFQHNNTRVINSARVSHTKHTISTNKVKRDGKENRDRCFNEASSL
jgi:hypothetical protein